MFYTLSKTPEFWENKLNGFIALAPLARITNNSNKMFKLISKEENMKALTLKEHDPDTWSIWGPFETAQRGTRQFCESFIKQVGSLTNKIIIIKYFHLFKDYEKFDDIIFD